MILPFPQQSLQPTPRSAGGEPPVEWIEWIFQEASHQTQASADLGHPLRDHIEGTNGASSTRALKLPDGTGAAWYILTIFGIFGVVFLLQVASNILERTGKSLEDTYYSSVTPELNKKGLQNSVPRCSALTASNSAALQPSQPSLGPTRAGQQPPRASLTLESQSKPAFPGPVGGAALSPPAALGEESSREWGWKSALELGALPANRGVSRSQRPGSFSGFLAH